MKGILSQQRIRHQALTEYIFCRRSIIQIESVTERLLKAVQRMFGSCMRLLKQCLRTIVQPIKPNKHQRLADPLLQSGFVTRNNRVWYAVKSTRNSYLVKPLISRKEHRAGATSQTVIASAPVLNFKLSSGSFWFLFWTPAPGKMPSSYTPAPKPWIWRYFHKNSERNISVVLQAFSSAI